MQVWLGSIELARNRADCVTKVSRMPGGVNMRTYLLSTRMENESRQARGYENYGLKDDSASVAGREQTEAVISDTRLTFIWSK